MSSGGPHHSRGAAGRNQGTGSGRRADADSQAYAEFGQVGLRLGAALEPVRLAALAVGLFDQNPALLLRVVLDQPRVRTGAAPYPPAAEPMGVAEGPPGHEAADPAAAVGRVGEGRGEKDRGLVPLLLVRPQQRRGLVVEAHDPGDAVRLLVDRGPDRGRPTGLPGEFGGEVVEAYPVGHAAVAQPVRTGPDQGLDLRPVIGRG